MKRRFNLIFAGTIFIFIILLIFTIFTFNGIEKFWANSDNLRVSAVETALERAAVQCYALEGSYPPDLEYLQKHYGIIIDKKKYFYDYSIFASNIKPEIQVFRRNTKEGVIINVQ